MSVCPAVSTEFGKYTPFWHDFTPFGHVADWCAPDWLKNTTRWRQFHLVVVVARGKDYVSRRNDSDPLKRGQRT